MSHFLLEPEPAGRVNESSVFLDPYSEPPLIEQLHFQFDFWYGDDIICDISVFLATKPLADELGSAGLSGMKLKHCELTKSSDYLLLQRRKEKCAPNELPEFLWLDVNGEAFHDDFGLLLLGADPERPDLFGLIISQRALDILKKHKLNKAKIRDLEDL